MLHEIDLVLAKLAWMEKEGIWPNGQRYLWTDAFGLVLLVSLYDRLGEERYLQQAEELVAEVDRVLGRAKGYRIGEEADRDGQYFHYLAMWIYALHRLGKVKPEYREKAIGIVKDIHPHFVQPGVGVIWKMEEDLSGMYPGYGYGALDAFHGYVVYRLLDPEGLASEIDEMKDLVNRSYPDLVIDQDLGLGMMLWMCHFFPDEPWAIDQCKKSLALLDRLWNEKEGWFARQTALPHMKFAFTNYGVSLGLQGIGEWESRVRRINLFFSDFCSDDEYDQSAITHVMACTSYFPGGFLVPGSD